MSSFQTENISYELNLMKQKIKPLEEKISKIETEILESSGNINISVKE